MQRIIKQLEKVWESRPDLDEKTPDKEKINQSIKALNNTLNELKEPLKKIATMKKVISGYIIQAEALVDENTQINIFEL